MSNDLAKAIKNIRTEARHTPAAAAKAVGVSRQAFVKWEQGDTKNMKLANLLTFCDYFKVNVEDLLRGTTSASQVDQLYQKAADEPPRPALAVAEPDPDIKRLIEGFTVADQGLRRAMMALARESLVAFERRSEKTD